MEEQKEPISETSTTEAGAATETPAVAPVVESTTGAAATVVAPAAQHLSKVAMWYVLAFVIIAIIGLGLWLVLEKDGRVSTTMFAPITNYLKSGEAVALVNGVEISRLDYDSTLRQLTANTTQQGVDVTDPTILGDLKNQAIESLVNTEILRQTAIAAGGEVLAEDIDARYSQIESSIGGPEALEARMKELLVTKAMLRRDIENDLLIQAYLDKNVDRSIVTVSDEEVTALYEQAAAAGNQLPPLTEIRDQVEAQIRFNKEQAQVAQYVDDLRQNAEVTTLLEE